MKKHNPALEPIRILRRDEIPSEIFNQFSSLERLFWEAAWEVIEAKEKESGGRVENTAGRPAQVSTKTHDEVSSCQ